MSAIISLLGLGLRAYAVAPHAGAIAGEGAQIAANILKIANALSRRAARIDANARDDMVRRMQARAPRRTGALIAHIEGHAEGDVHVVSAIVHATRQGGEGPDYAPFVEYGTGPHAIGARRPVAQRRQNHPGTEAQPFFWPVVSEVFAERRITMDSILSDAAAEGGMQTE